MSDRGDIALRSWIESLGALKTFATDAAPDVAAAVRAGLTRTMSAGQDPYGKPHEPTLDGRVPLTGAAKDMSVTTLRSTVLVRLTGVAAKHHFGAVRGGKIRRLIPITRDIPEPIVADAKQRLYRRFETEVRGG